MMIYRIAETEIQQELFDDFPIEPNIEDFGNEKDFIEECVSLYENPVLFKVLEKNGFSVDEVSFPGEQRVLLVETESEKFVVEDKSIYEANEWIHSKSLWDLQDYYPEPEEESFWNNVYPGTVLYHATPDDNVESINANGLKVMDKSRGIANRGTGAAVFASENIEEIDSYGANVYEINMGLMKQDGYCPTVEREEPIAEDL